MLLGVPVRSGREEHVSDTTGQNNSAKVGAEEEAVVSRTREHANAPSDNHVSGAMLDAPARSGQEENAGASIRGTSPVEACRSDEAVGSSNGGHEKASIGEDIPSQVRTDVEPVISSIGGQASAPSDIQPEVVELFCEEDIKCTPVPPHDAGLMRVVLTPRIGSCIYTCIALSKLQIDVLHEWNCVYRHENGVARDPERAALEKKWANDVALSVRRR